MYPFSTTKNSFLKRGQRDNGQIVVEYVLLLVAAVGIAVLMTSLMVSRDPEHPGFLVVKWRQIIEVIGKDVVDTSDDGTP
ncbi:MAG: hypothetical protein KDD34_02430 [Bdellovibrionales bacterium]|nr:hypothetical protein [Bdellovibrionales bacterium]